jgi:hypothetical protein
LLHVFNINGPSWTKQGVRSDEMMVDWIPHSVETPINDVTSAASRISSEIKIRFLCSNAVVRLISEISAVRFNVYEVRLEGFNQINDQKSISVFRMGELAQTKLREAARPGEQDSLWQVIKSTRRNNNA